MPLDLARHADRMLETDGFFERRCADAHTARRGGHAEYFADVVEQGKRAQAIEEWTPSLVGLLQTDASARAVIHASNPREAVESVDAKVSARLGSRPHLREGVLVRDSKRSAGPFVAVGVKAWAAFVAEVWSHPQR